MKTDFDNQNEKKSNAGNGNGQGYENSGNGNPGNGNEPGKGKPEKEITYSLDGEPQITKVRELTAKQILINGKLDPEQYYLILQKEEGNVSYKDSSGDIIKLHNNMVFLSTYRGAMTVS